MIPLLTSSLSLQAPTSIQQITQTLVGVFPTSVELTPENLSRLCSVAKALGYKHYCGIVESNLNNIKERALYLYFDCQPKSEQKPSLILPSLAELWHTPEKKRALWGQLKKYKYEK